MSKYLRNLSDSDVVDNMKRLNSSDYFELVYMRHNYFRNAENPAPGRLESFEEMLCNISNKIYFRNEDVFKDVGFEVEDLQNIARVHTVSFISMCGLYENEDKMQDFIKRHKKTRGQKSNPDKKDIFRKECFDLARFLDQRIQEVAMFCNRKNKNIRGTKNTVSYFVGKPRKTFNNEDVVRDPEFYGFRKITRKEFKKLESKKVQEVDNDFVIDDGSLVKTVYLRGQYITKRDMSHIGLDLEQNMFYRNPEDNIIQLETENELEEKLKQKRKK